MGEVLKLYRTIQDREAYNDLELSTLRKYPHNTLATRYKWCM